MQTIQQCDQLEQALLSGDSVAIEAVRKRILLFFTLADEADLRVAIECARARANEVLREEDDLEP